MSSLAALSAPNQNTKPGSIIYIETLAAKNLNVKDLIAENIVTQTLTSQSIDTNLLVSQSISSNTINCNLLTSSVVQTDRIESKGDLEIVAGNNINMTGHLYSNGFNVPCWRASQIEEMHPILNTTDELPVIPDQLAGSMTIKPRVNNGFTLKINTNYRLIQGGGTEFTFYLKINDNTFEKIIIPATGGSDQEQRLDITLEYREGPNVLAMSSSVLRHKDYTILQAGTYGGIWDPNIDNTFSMTGQFNDTDGQWFNNTFDMLSSQST